jgi:hypothetical protein
MTEIYLIRRRPAAVGPRALARLARQVNDEEIY